MEAADRSATPRPKAIPDSKLASLDFDQHSEVEVVF